MTCLTWYRRLLDTAGEMAHVMPSPMSQLRMGGRRSCAMGGCVPLFAIALSLIAAGCATTAETRTSTRTLGVPASDERDPLVLDFARRAYGLAQADRLSELLLDDLELRDLLGPEAATHRAAIGHTGQTSARSVPALGRKLLANSEFLGVCVQGVRVESSGGVLGLSADGWVFDRMLLVGSHGVGGTVGLWIEGIFVRTDAGLRALTLERVEAPRREHADLELALCDLRLGGL